MFRVIACTNAFLHSVWKGTLLQIQKPMHEKTYHQRAEITAGLILIPRTIHYLRCTNWTKCNLLGRNINHLCGKKHKDKQTDKDRQTGFSNSLGHLWFRDIQEALPLPSVLRCLFLLSLLLGLALLCLPAEEWSMFAFQYKQSIDLCVWLLKKEKGRIRSWKEKDWRKLSHKLLDI